jgi:glycosyltransferase involved in cell wall biosynthesis
MIYLGFPYGSHFGWGVLGKEVALAMAQMTDVRVLSPPKADQRLDDEFDLFRIRKLLATPQDQGRKSGKFWQVDGPVIQAAIGRDLAPFMPGLAPPADVGYAVFEENILPPAVIAQAWRQYRHLAAASNYCAQVLRQHKLTNVSVVPHGVDTTLFCPRAEPRSFLTDRFIVFSGGKFELRKGQDIVIRAYKVLQDRHPDVMLVNSWHNAWPKYRDTMAASKLIRYTPPRHHDYVAWMNNLLVAHGIDIERVITVGQRDHRLLPGLYHATDLGLFPNRVEGGNNMVLMEYMACGKPALVSYNSGHTDIVRRSNAVLIECHKPMERRTDAEVSAVWNDPSLEETIDKLEWCYQHRDQLQPLARQAGIDMRAFSWDRLAAGLLGLAQKIDVPS